MTLAPRFILTPAMDMTVLRLLNSFCAASWFPEVAEGFESPCTFTTPSSLNTKEQRLLVIDNVFAYQRV